MSLRSGKIKIVNSSVEVLISSAELRVLHLVLEDAYGMDQWLLEIPEERITALASKLKSLSTTNGKAFKATLYHQEVSDLFGILNHANDEISKEYDEKVWMEIDAVNESVAAIARAFIAIA